MSVTLRRDIRAGIVAPVARVTHHDAEGIISSAASNNSERISRPQSTGMLHLCVLSFRSQSIALNAPSKRNKVVIISWRNDSIHSCSGGRRCGMYAIAAAAGVLASSSQRIMSVAATNAIMREIGIGGA